MTTNRPPIDDGAPEHIRDSAKIDQRTDDEVLDRAMSDPDNPLLLPAEVERLHRGNRFRELRQGLHLSVFQFAERFAIPYETAVAWETGQELPDAGSLVLFRVIETEPELVTRLLASRAAD